jgi:antitoxin component HigA of HigAB toxin-antitoxin module
VQYRPIKSLAQYNSYVMYLGRLSLIKDKSESEIESMESLISFIKNWDLEHNTVSISVPVTAPYDPIERLISIMKKNNIRLSDLATALQISQTALSDILNHKRELTTDIIARISKQLGMPLLV